MDHLLQVRDEGDLMNFIETVRPGIKRTRVRQWVKHGSVLVNGQTIQRLPHTLNAGDKVEIRSKPSGPPAPPLPRGMQIRHEDGQVLVVEKPAGMLSIASKSQQANTVYSNLTDYMRKKHRGRGERVWIVHRLDKETSGLMVFARTETAKRRLQADWSQVEKRYFAVVDGVPKSKRGTLRHHLDESNAFRVRVAPEGEDTREALTQFEVLETHQGRALMELVLETGRRHQIRVQLAAAGCPVLGDGKYHSQADRKDRLALHSCLLRFPHPGTGQMMHFESALPDALKRLL